MEYIIETENLTKQYGTATVVDNINLHVPKGKIYSLLGRNGAGKTTAMFSDFFANQRNRDFSM